MRGELVDFAGRFVYNSDREPCFNFGKHKGRPITEVLRREPSYYSWMMQGDFPQYTKKVLQAIKQRMSAPKTGMSDTDKLQALQQKFNLR